MGTASEMCGTMSGKKISQTARLGGDFPDEAFFRDKFAQQFRVPRPGCGIIPEDVSMGDPNSAVCQHPFVALRYCGIVVTGKKGDRHFSLEEEAPQFLFEGMA